MSIQAPYIYRPLEDGQIRLLVLFPGTGDEEVVIALVHRPRRSKPIYEALSYVWGSSDRTDEVTVTQASASRIARLGGHAPQASKHLKRNPASRNESSRLAIGRNLFVALQHLRRKDEARGLWVDAISINQDDPEERSKEVARMGGIYRRARRVVVWLGGGKRR